MGIGLAQAIAGQNIEGANLYKPAEGARNAIAQGLQHRESPLFSGRGHEMAHAVILVS